MKITIVAGSPREVSVTLRIAKSLKAHLEKLNHEISFLDMREIQMPFIEQVWVKPEMVPSDKLYLWELMHNTQAFIVVSPEYNGGYSPALKNFLDHFPKPVYEFKAFGIATGSPGKMGGIRSAQQLLLMVAGYRAIASPTLLIVPEMDKKYNEQGQLLDDSFKKQEDAFISDFLKLAAGLS